MALWTCSCGECEGCQAFTRALRALTSAQVRDDIAYMRTLRDAPSYAYVPKGEFHSTWNDSSAEQPPKSLRIERAKMLIEIGKTAHILSPEAEEEIRAAMLEQIERDCQEILGGPYFYVGGPMTVSWSEPSDPMSWVFPDAGSAALDALRATAERVENKWPDRLFGTNEEPDLLAITRDIARGG